MKKQKLSTESKKNGRPAGGTERPRNERTELLTVEINNSTSPKKSKAKAPKNTVKKQGVTGLLGGDASKTSPTPEPLNLPGISDEIAARAGIRKAGALEAKDLCELDVSGLWIPYTDRNGEPVMVEDESGKPKPYGRLRLDRPEPNKKYHQAPDSGVHLYIPDGDYRNISRLAIVEGEKSSLSLSSLGIPAVGISGFYGFQERCEDKKRLLEELQDIFLLAGDCEIEFVGDNDTVLNHQFADAAVKLSQHISEASGGDSVKIVLPRIPINGPKGIDDLIDHLQKQGEDPLTVYNGLERVTFDSGGYAGGSGAAALRWDILKAELTSNPVGLKAELLNNSKLEGRLFECIEFMKHSPTSYQQAKEKMREFLDLDKTTFNQGLTAARKELKELAPFAEKSKEQVTEILLEIEEKGFTLGAKYLYPMPDGVAWGIAKVRYRSFTQTEIERELIARYELTKKQCSYLDGGLSQVDTALRQIKAKPELDYAGPVAGYSKPGAYTSGGSTFLVTDGFVIPKSEKGDWSLHKEFLERFCGRNAGDPHWETQVQCLMGWLQQFRLQMLDQEGEYLGQALAIVGEPDSGKTWWQENIAPKLISGRFFPQKLQNLSSQFNAETARNEIISFSDSTGDTDYRQRERIADHVRAFVANPKSSIEKKGQDRISLPLKQRLIISANMTGIAALPPLKGGVEDKVMYLKGYRVKLWNGSKDPKAKETIRRLLDQIPAFCYAIDNYGLPVEMADERFGVKAFHHPEIVEETETGKPWEITVQYLEKLIQCNNYRKGTEWQSPMDLYQDIANGVGNDAIEKVVRRDKFPYHLRYAKRELKGGMITIEHRRMGCGGQWRILPNMKAA
ncbi:DUF3854 domain-containing protein [Verrucomicrobia bacterium]|nr:DUF3854 domain-containing protein [Verrucomicrobiota bacterium]